VPGIKEFFKVGYCKTSDENKLLIFILFNPYPNMENLYYGLAVFVICAIGLYFSWKLHSDNKVLIALILLIVCGIILRIYVSADLFLHEWDERFHALVAKNLIKQPFIPKLYASPLMPYDYKNWGCNFIWVHKQPVPLWCISLSLWIAGINEFAVRLPSVILSSCGILLTYYIARYLYDSKVAFISAFLFAINGKIIALAGGRNATDHIDVFFLFFIMLAVWLAIKFVKSKNQFYNILCGISIGLAILSKWLPALIVLPVWYLLVLDSRRFSKAEIVKNFAILLAITVLVFLPWQFYIYHQFPLEAKWEASFNFKHLTEGLEGHGRPFFYHFLQLGQLYGELVYLPILWFMYKSFFNRLNYRRLLILIWFLIPLMFFTFSKTKMPAYTIFSSPSLCIMAGLFFVYIRRYSKKFNYRIASTLILVLLIALPARQCIVKTKMFQKYDRNPVWVRDIKALEPLGRKCNGKLVIFNTGRPIETMFYVDCVAYSILPTQEKIIELEKKGYKVIVIN
jgi:4-amino-4-deoxy-L-arabinose transferase-like glycosyltransferase